MRELELKLAVPGSFVMPSRAEEAFGVSSVDELPDLDMKTTYYDTEDLRLARCGITLRYRTGEEGGARWTLKLPIPGEDATSHEEHHFKGASNRVPESGRDLLTAYVRSASLSAVASVRTRRHRWMLRDQQGTELCELVDDEVSVLEGSKIVARFREVEIEARAFDRAKLLSVSRALRNAGAMAAEPIPKAVRAMGARATAPPDVRADYPVLPGEPAGEAVKGALSRALDRLIVHDPGVRFGEDVESVHQMRVATRRIRSDLRTFEPLIDPAWARDLIDRLRSLGRALGAVRDIDVQRLHLTEEVSGLGMDVTPLFDHLARVHVPARRALLKQMRSDDYTKLLEDLVAAAADPRLSAAAREASRDVLPSLVAQAWNGLAKVARKIKAKDPDEAYHAVRVGAKRARYAAEAVAPALGADADYALSFAKRCAKLQDALGELQDAAVVSETILHIAEQHSEDGALNLALGWLLEREHRRKIAARAAFKGLWGSLDSKKNVKWFRS